MACKKKWERDFCQKNLNRSYFNGDYKDHRKNLLFETEKARLPETMPAVEAYKSVRGLEIEKKKQKEEIQRLRTQYHEAQRKYNATCSTLNHAKRGESASKEKDESRKFIKKCPSDDCEGFLSTAWKCAVCNIWACPDCMEIKGYEKDAEHTCDPNILASAKLIKTDTKPCPSCSVRIFKISGCDQMWCTSCKVAFSWRTGKRINGVIHNPHFYEYARNNGGAVNNPGAVACGGIPTYYSMRDIIRGACNSREFIEAFLPIVHQAYRLATVEGAAAPRGAPHSLCSAFIMKMHRGANHFQYTILDSMRQTLQRNRDNKDLRIKFIVGEITENKMKSTLISRDTKYAKLQSLLHINELMGAVYTEVLITIYNALRDFNNNKSVGASWAAPAARETVNIINENIKKLNRVRIYCNKELLKVSIIYGQSVQIIDNAYNTHSMDKKKSNYYLKNGKCDFMVQLDNSLRPVVINNQIQFVS